MHGDPNAQGLSGCLQRPLTAIRRQRQDELKTITPTDKDVLVGIDIQNDFCAGGALAVPNGEETVALTNRLARYFENVVLTQDWHPKGHLSFASSHPGKSPLETTDMPYGPQVLWPDHCIQNTKGTAFHDGLEVAHTALIIRKGFRPNIDSYSAFYENDQQTVTGLSGYLRQRGLRRVFLTGLATDFCVQYSALDARKEGFETVVIEDACRAIDIEGSLDAAMAAMLGTGVDIIQSKEIVAIN